MQFLLPYLFVFSFLGCTTIAEVPAHHENIEKLYQAGEKAMQSSDWGEAVTKLQLLNLKYPNNAHVEQAKLSIVFCYMQRKEFTKALSSIHAFINDYPESPSFGEAISLRNELEKLQIAAEARNASWNKENNYQKSSTLLWVGAPITCFCVIVLAGLGFAMYSSSAN